MKVMGLKIVPVLVATVVVYAIGAVIYGALFSEHWMTWNGMTKEDFKGYEMRMALSWIMPLALAVGIGLKLKTKQITQVPTGMKEGAFVGLLLILGCRLYTYVYGTEPWQLLALDSVHLLLDCVAAGAVLTAMKISED